MIAEILKFIMGMKVGTLLTVVGGGIVVLSILINILKGTFSVAKFASGFNPFSGPVQGKLIYYGVILILAFGLYHQLTRATTNYDTDYRNNIKGNQDVFIDERTGPTCVPTRILWGAIQIGCKTEPMNKVVTYKPNGEKVEEVKK